MVKAHSLLYAIYICLIVSIICGALLYFANLFTQLNLHYNLHEELYLHNQSLVNFALDQTGEEMPQDDNFAIKGDYESKPYGLLTILSAKSSVQNDTVTSIQFIGSFSANKTALHVANLTKPLSYSGTVSIIGDSHLPFTQIGAVYIENKPNKLTMKGNTSVSERALPEINPLFKKIFDTKETAITPFSDIEKPKDSLYYNSFHEKTKHISLPASQGNTIFKGNFCIRAKDSLVIKRNTVLEDVILMAPKIIIEDGFTGSVQAFATKSITIGENVTLHYPSVVCVYNESDAESFIRMGKDVKITGAIVLFGNDITQIDKNIVEIEEGSQILGDIYCSGKLMLKGKIRGSVYSNRLFYKNASAGYDNTISEVEINASARPAYFIGIPLFEAKKNNYGILKKVL